MRIASCECECELWMWVRIWVRIEPQQLLLLLERDRAQFGAAFQVLLSLYRFWPPPLLFFLSLSALIPVFCLFFSICPDDTLFSPVWHPSQMRCWFSISVWHYDVPTQREMICWGQYTPLHYDLYENAGGSLSRFSPNWKHSYLALRASSRLSLPLYVSSFAISIS